MSVQNGAIADALSKAADAMTAGLDPDGAVRLAAMGDSDARYVDGVPGTDLYHAATSAIETVLDSPIEFISAVDAIPVARAEAARFRSH